MSRVADNLRLKYGLGHVPSDSSVQDWLRLAKKYIDQGYDKDTAGQRAAKDLFSDYQTHFFAAEADSIETLLRLADDK